MKKLHHNEVSKHFTMSELTKARWDLLPMVYELKAHNTVTLDMNPSFGHIAQSFKECRKTHEYKDLQLYKIDNATKRKTIVVMNPEFR